MFQWRSSSTTLLVTVGRKCNASWIPAHSRFSALCFDQPGWHWAGRLLWLPPLSSKEVCKWTPRPSPVPTYCCSAPAPCCCRPDLLPSSHMVPCWGYHTLCPVTSTLLWDFIAQSCTFPCSYSIKTLTTMSTKSFWALKYSTVRANALTWSS